IAARTRCSPAVSRKPFFNESRPRSSCSRARTDHAAHQSSQRSSEAVTSSKSASSTPFETKRGAQWEIAEATLVSLDTQRARVANLVLQMMISAHRKQCSETRFALHGTKFGRIARSRRRCFHSYHVQSTDIRYDSSKHVRARGHGATRQNASCAGPNQAQAL